MANLEEEKHELERFTLNPSSLIASMGTQLDDPHNHPLLIALQHEVTTANRKMHEVVRNDK